MRYLFFLLFIPFIGNAQQFYNTSCATAKFLCENDPGDSLLDVEACTGSFDAFYYYRTETAGTSVPVIDFSTDASSGYEVYGPYEDLTDACGSLLPAYKVGYSGSNSTTHTVSHNTQVGLLYVLKIHFTVCPDWFKLSIKTDYKPYMSNSWSLSGCTGCIPAFRPPSGVYVVSAWTKDTEAQEVDSTTTYLRPYLNIVSGTINRTLTPSGDIIDGWQRIQDTVTLINEDFNLSFGCGSGGDCFFDDIRIFPTDGAMVTYVYDPLTFRLMAELDDNNYAKFYEYDEDGKLIRVKKETERGIMTIQESRENNSKR